MLPDPLGVVNRRFFLRGETQRTVSASRTIKVGVITDIMGPLSFLGTANPLILCTGPVPAQQVEPVIPWLMQNTGAEQFYWPSADYIWPHTMNRKLRKVATAHGGSIVGEEYFPLDHSDYGATIEKVMSSAGTRRPG